MSAAPSVAQTPPSNPRASCVRKSCDHQLHSRSQLLRHQISKCVATAHDIQNPSGRAKASNPSIPPMQCYKSVSAHPACPGLAIFDAHLELIVLVIALVLGWPEHRSAHSPYSVTTRPRLILGSPLRSGSRSWLMRVLLPSPASPTTRKTAGDSGDSASLLAARTLAVALSWLLADGSTRSR